LENPPTNHDQTGDAATSSPTRDPVVAEVVTVAPNNVSTSIGFKRPSLDEETAAMNAMLRLGAQDPSAARKRARLGRTKVCSFDIVRSQQSHDMPSNSFCDLSASRVWSSPSRYPSGQK
jgi:hypothetical protein